MYLPGKWRWKIAEQWSLNDLSKPKTFRDVKGCKEKVVSVDFQQQLTAVNAKRNKEKRQTVYTWSLIERHSVILIVLVEGEVHFRHQPGTLSSNFSWGCWFHICVIWCHWQSLWRRRSVTSFCRNNMVEEKERIGF